MSAERPVYGDLGRAGVKPPSVPGKHRKSPDTAVSGQTMECWACGSDVDDEGRCRTGRCPMFGQTPGAV